MKPMTMAVLLARLYLGLQRNGSTSAASSGMLGSETHDVLNKIDRTISNYNAIKQISQNRNHLSYLNINQINANMHYVGLGHILIPMGLAVMKNHD
jgi:hypothetical protein